MNNNPSSKPNLNLGFFSKSESPIREADLETFFREMIATKDSLVLATQKPAILQLEKLLFLPSGYIECIRGIWENEKGAQVVIDLLCPILGNRVSITVIKKLRTGYSLFISKYRSDLNVQPELYLTHGSVTKSINFRDAVLSFRFMVAMALSVIIGERNSIHLQQKYLGISVEDFNSLAGASKTVSFCSNMLSTTPSFEEAKVVCQRVQSLGYTVGAIIENGDLFQIISALPSGFAACPSTISNLLGNELGLEINVSPELTGFVAQIQPMITKITVKNKFEITMHNGEELEAIKSLLRTSALEFTEEEDSLVTTKLLVERAKRGPIW
ncbi:conserved hypothetical protein [Vibrio chagasii]|nr:conserved hypothetical protein [Vibrio chagasii]CAH7365072.1 conserved hypothetical protein [Vibrio chagasii]